MWKYIISLFCMVSFLSPAMAQDVDPLDVPIEDFDIEKVTESELQLSLDTTSATLELGQLRFKSADNSDRERFLLSMGFQEQANGRIAYGFRGTLGFTDDSFPALTVGGYVGLGARQKFLIMPVLDAGVLFQGVDPELLVQIGVKGVIYPGLFTLEGGIWDSFAISVEGLYAFLPRAALDDNGSYQSGGGDPMQGFRWMVGVVLPSFLPDL